jgi:triosephosphate isomerase (TIM)
MSDSVRALVAGNWKMNGTIAAAADLQEMIAGLARNEAGCDAMICPPSTLIGHFAHLAKDSDLAIGAQDCHTNEKGAHTGDLSAEILTDVGATAIIVGHSERRQDHAESNETVCAKAQAAWRAGAHAIICCGESDEQRVAGQALNVVGAQIRASLPEGATAETTTIAYEPIWAIGTGKTPTADDVAEMHAHIRQTLVELMGDNAKKMRILYGGSVKPANAVELMSVENVNGALVGGASLKAEDFLGIIAAYNS